MSLLELSCNGLLRFAPEVEASIWKKHGWRARRHQHGKMYSTVDTSDFSSVEAQTGRGPTSGREAWRLPTILVSRDSHQLNMCGAQANSAVSLPEIQRLRAATSWTGRRFKRSTSTVLPLNPLEGMPLVRDSPPLQSRLRRRSVGCVEFAFDSLGQHRAKWHETAVPSSVVSCAASAPVYDPAVVDHACAVVENASVSSHTSRFKGVGALAEALVNHCGSLERAFASFDYNHQGKLSRSQWETGLCLLRLDCEALCGISSKKLFKMMDDKRKREVELEGWMAFFRQLEGTAAADLLTDDFGPIRRRSVDLRRSFANSFPLPWKSSGRDSRPLNSLSSSQGFSASLPDLRSVPEESGRSAFQSKLGPLSRVNSASQRLQNGTLEDVQAGRRSPPVDVHSPVGRDKPDLRFNGWGEQVRQGSQEETGSDSQLLGDSTGDTEAGAGQHAAHRILLEDTAAETSEATSSSSSSPVSAKLQQALKAGSRNADLRGLNDEELDAIAEQEQLEEELQALDLTGVQALAYVLTAKLRSLQNAFRWFDTTRQGRIAHVSFSTGALLLHIDMERLTGMHASRVFGLMEGKVVDGLVTRNDWDVFFAAVCSGNFSELLKKARGDGNGGSLAERAKAKKEKLRQLRAAQQQGQSAVEHGEPAPVASRQARKTPEGHAAETAEDDTAAAAQSADACGELDTLPDEQYQSSRVAAASLPVSHQEQPEDSAPDPQRPADIHCRVAFESSSRGSERCSAFGDSESEFGTGTHLAWPQAQEADEPEAQAEEEACQHPPRAVNEVKDEVVDEEGDFRSHIRQELATLAFGDSQEYITEPGSWQSSIIQEVAEELQLWSHLSEEPTGVVILVHNSLDFASALRQQLLGIQTFEQLELPTSFTESQRQVVHIMAAELGLYTHSEGQGNQRRVVAYNMGDLAGLIRRDLSSLQSGQSKAFPPSFTLAQQRLVHAIAAELGLWVHTPRSTKSGCIEVHNQTDFAQRVRLELEHLMSGEHREFPMELTELQRKIVHCIAGELGLTSISQGEEHARFVVVANLADFLTEVRRDLCKLAPGESRVFEPVLSVLQRKVVHELAVNALGLLAECRDEGNGRYITVRRSHDGVLDTTFESSISTEVETQLTSGSPAAAIRRSQSECDESLEAAVEETEESVISRLFSVYATGFHRGERIFLRFPDLREFAEDAKDAMPSSYRRFHAFASDLENIFDDTLQLQIDMGTRTRKGLTLHWFQVFIQKAMRCIGRSVVGFLFALVASRSQ